MIKCSQCQFENPEGSKFCLQCCGSPTDLSCPRCGNLLPPSARFCNQCGHDLSKPKPTPLDYSAPQTYTPKHLAEQIHTSRSALEGERKLVTLLFSDVANYTSLSEKLDSEEAHQIMDGGDARWIALLWRIRALTERWLGRPAKSVELTEGLAEAPEALALP